MPQVIATYTHMGVTGNLEKVSDAKYVITIQYQGVVVLTEEYSDYERAMTNWHKVLIDPRFFVPKKDPWRGLYFLGGSVILNLFRHTPEQGTEKSKPPNGRLGGCRVDRLMGKRAVSSNGR